MNNLYKIIILGLILLINITSSWAMEQEEEILWREIPEVVTAARERQPITEAPSAITVITEKDIKHSGATNIPDVLRQVAGLDVMMVTASDFQVSARGFNSALSNKMLVMIDGRSVYINLYGMVVWESLPITLEEIKKIEVIKGPGAALYGANAYCGVINIITKSPEELKGRSISVTLGTYQTLQTSLIEADVRGKLSYKASAGWNRVNQWEERNETAKRGGTGNLALQYKISADSKISFMTGSNDSISEMAIGKSFPMNRETRFPYIQLNYDKADLKVRLFWNGLQGKVTNQDQAARTFITKTDTYDAEVQHSLKIGTAHSLVYGGSFRIYRIKGGPNKILDRNHQQNLGAIFAQDNFKIRKDLTLLIGVRHDHHPLTKDQISPRTSLIYTPAKNHSFRLASSTAFRNPTFVDNYVLWTDNYPLGKIVPSTRNTALENLPVIIESRGNKKLDPEKITSFELGYQNYTSQVIRPECNLFFNQYKDIIGEGAYDIITAYPTPPFPAGLPSNVSIQMENVNHAQGIGGEIGCRFLLRKNLDGLFNYSCQRITWTKDNPHTTTEDEKNKRIKSNPAHKVNAGLNLKLKNNLSANVLAHWVSKTEMAASNFSPPEKVAAYMIVNTRLGYQFLDNKADLALAVFNIFNRKHYEYPAGDDLTLPYGDEVGRRLTLYLHCKF